MPGSASFVGRLMSCNLIMTSPIPREGLHLPLKTSNSYALDIICKNTTESSNRGFFSTVLLFGWEGLDAGAEDG